MGHYLSEMGGSYEYPSEMKERVARQKKVSRLEKLLMENWGVKESDMEIVKSILRKWTRGY